MNISNLLPKLKRLSYADKLKVIEFLATEIDQEQTEKKIVDQSDIVILKTANYQKILDELEELEEIKAYDEAIASDDEVIPFEQAILEIEQNR